uniref:Uncharacterized protein n=1 Tax=Alexandrium catenella TaxID=2925 RepID=A0A7S1S7T8_ALECA
MRLEQASVSGSSPARIPYPSRPDAMRRAAVVALCLLGLSREASSVKRCRSEQLRTGLLDEAEAEADVDAASDVTLTPPTKAQIREREAHAQEKIKRMADQDAKIRSAVQKQRRVARRKEQALKINQGEWEEAAEKEAAERLHREVKEARQAELSAVLARKREEESMQRKVVIEKKRDRAQAIGKRDTRIRVSERVRNFAADPSPEDMVILNRQEETAPPRRPPRVPV